MYCETTPQKPEKPTCRCKNCMLRAADVVPWDLMPVKLHDGEKDSNRRIMNNKRRSMESVYSTENVTEEHSPIQNGGTTPSSPVQEAPPPQAPPPPPAQPTILLIVVNKPETPSFSGRGYPGPGPGYPGRDPRGYQGPPSRGYQGTGPRGSMDTASRGYPGSGPRRPPGRGPGARNGYAVSPGPGTEPTRRYEDHVRFNNYINYRNGYQDDWRGQPRRYSNNDYTRSPGRTPGAQRSCQCREKSNKSSLQSPAEHAFDDIDEDRFRLSGNRGNENRLEGSGNCKNPISSEDVSENSDMHMNEGRQHNCSMGKREENMQDVVVTDDSNKTFKCIQVPICISVGKPDRCRCCKCASAPDTTSASFTDSKSKMTADGHVNECLCLDAQDSNVSDPAVNPNEFDCECNLTDLERTLRDLIPHEDCMCFLKKKRRRRRKKCHPKVYYDRFANPPFVLNPRPRCLEYGCSPCSNPCCSPYCCGPVGQSCYITDYCCGKRCCC